MFFFFCVVRKATAYVNKKALDMNHQSQERFCGIFLGIPQHQKLYLVYVPHTRKIIYSYDVVFDEIFFSALVYTSQPYSEAMNMCQLVSYIPSATSSKKQTGDIIMFAQFEEKNLLSETCEDVESDDKSGGKSDENSNMTRLLSSEESNVLNSGNESDDEPMSMELLEYIFINMCNSPQWTPVVSIIYVKISLFEKMIKY